MLEDYFCRARAIELLTARNPAFGDVEDGSGSRAATVGVRGPGSLGSHTASREPAADDLLARLEQEFDRVIRALDAVLLRRRSHDPGGGRQAVY